MMRAFVASLTASTSSKTWTTVFAMTALAVPMLPSVAIAQTTVAGVTSGALSVDETGSAGYTIPIAVPPGIAGMQPSLALVYKSHGGNSSVGVGWSLNASSSIHRCGQTLAQDGAIHDVDFSDDDRFCLDGRRLVAINGVYGADGTEYRTEIDRFARIISYGSAGSGPERFTVENKAGQTMEYGHTADSRLVVPGAREIRLWSLNRVTDTVGNAMTYHYTEDLSDHSYRLDRIEYTHNDTQAVLAQSEVRFIYESRVDTPTSYLAGTEMAISKRLSKIETYTDTDSGLVLVKDYRLTYELSPASNRSRLTAVTECDGTSNCLAPVTFDWQGQALTYADAVDVSSSWGTTMSMWDGTKRFAHILDFNGDGRSDILLQGTSSSHSTHLLTSNGAGFDMEDVTNLWGMSATIWAANGRSLFVLDYNGDGRDDILLQGVNSTQSSRLLTANSTGFNNVQNITSAWGTSAAVWAANQRDLIVLDHNGDGLDDILLRGEANPGVTYLLTSNGAGFSNKQNVTSSWGMSAGHWSRSTRPLSVLDYNGDGRDDLLLQSPGQASKTYLLTANSTGFDSVIDITSFWGMTQDLWPSSRRNLFVLDHNGDGLDDILLQIKTNGSSILLTSHGKGFYRDSSIHNNWGLAFGDLRGDRRKITILDVNGDGLSDVLLQGKEATEDTYLLIGKGAGWQEEFFDVETISAAWGTSIETWNETERNLLVLDHNGDGLSDLLLKDKDSGQSTLLLTQDGPAPDLLTSITDSLGRISTLNYAPLTDTVVYTKDVDAVFPVVDVQAPLYVVKSVSADNGVGGQAVSSYHYIGAKAHVQGRGFYGFRQVTATDESSGIVTTTDYHQDFPYTAQISQSVKTLADGTTIKTIDNTWDQLSLNGGDTVYPYVGASISEDYEINDGVGNSPVVSRTAIVNLDTYGNPTSLTRTITDGSESFVETTINTYDVDLTNWFLGLINNSEVTFSRPGVSNLTQESSFTYNPTTALIAQQVSQPNQPDIGLTTTYDYDGFGNQTSVTVDGPDIASRTTTASFTADGRYLVSAANALNHNVSSVIDARFGTVIELTGPNGLVTTWAYDGFGRKTKETRADGTETRWSYDLCAAQCPNGGVYAISAQDFDSNGFASTAKTIEYLDKLNRVLRTETEGFDGTPIYVDTQFNSRGEVHLISKPYFQGASAQDILWTINTYDAVGRLVSANLPDGGVESTAYSGLTTTLTNALNQNSVRVENALGELVSTTDAMLNETTYAYDALGNLTETNAVGVITTYSYDVRGLKTAMDDPDMGNWSYGYNSMGELVRQTDAEGQTTAMAYDLIGRMVARTDDFGTPEAVTTTWTFDTATNGIGKIDIVSAPHDGYSESISYDNLGRPSAASVTIDGKSYDTSTLYDDAGRADTLVYPSGFTVKSVFTARGHLAEVTDSAGTLKYWQADSVNAEGQVTSETLGNGVTTTRVYDPATSRINSISTVKPDAPATTIQDLAFDFDYIGNLTARRDLRQSLEELFTYDNLNRLTGTALTDIAGPVGPGTPQTLLEAPFAADEEGFIYSDGLFGGSSPQDYATGEWDSGGKLALRLGGSDNNTVSDMSGGWTQSFTLTTEMNVSLSFSYAMVFSAYYEADEHSQLLLSFDGGIPVVVAEFTGDGNGGLNGETGTQTHVADLGVLQPGTYSFSIGAYNNQKTWYSEWTEITLDDVVVTGTPTSGGASLLGSTTYSYDSLGNIINKSDLGAYTYGTGLPGQPGPHAVVSVALTGGGTDSYTYDANGSMLTGAGKTTIWTSFNKPAVIADTLTGDETGFVYGPSRARITQQIIKGGLSTHVTYVGSHYEKKERLGEDDELVHYIRAGATIAVYTEYRDAMDTVTDSKTRYTHRDHLGSIATLTDELGAVTESLSYDPHGKRRLADWQAGTPVDPAETPRGFTGHEHLDAVGLIHMNGRVYDPTLGRFLSADPIVLYPETSQGFNRYSYTDNNPLSYTDPSGFGWREGREIEHGRNNREGGYGSGIAGDGKDEGRVRDDDLLGRFNRLVEENVIGPLERAGINVGYDFKGDKGIYRRLSTAERQAVIDKTNELVDEGLPAEVVGLAMSGFIASLGGNVGTLEKIANEVANGGRLGDLPSFSSTPDYQRATATLDLIASIARGMASSNLTTETLRHNAVAPLVVAGIAAVIQVARVGLPIAARIVARTFSPGNVLGLASLKYASRYGIKSYRELSKLTKGTGLEAHHLIEKRFASLFGVHPRDMLSVALTRAEHAAFTKAWRQAIPYGRGTATATTKQVRNAARQIYKDYPEISKALGL